MPEHAPDRGHDATLAEEMHEWLSNDDCDLSHIQAHVIRWAARVQALEHEVARLAAERDTQAHTMVTAYRQWAEDMKALEREVARLKDGDPDRGDYTDPDDE